MARRLCRSHVAAMVRDLVHVQLRTTKRALSTVLEGFRHENTSSSTDRTAASRVLNEGLGTGNARPMSSRTSATSQIKRVRRTALSETERESILALKKQGLSLSEIAISLDRTQNVVKRVLYHSGGKARTSKNAAQIRWLQVDKLQQKEMPWDRIAEIIGDEANRLRTWYLRERVNMIGMEARTSRPYSAEEDRTLLALRYEKKLRWGDVGHALARTTTSVAARHSVLVSRASEDGQESTVTLPLTVRDIGKAARMRRNGFDWTEIVKAFPFKDSRNIKAQVAKRLRMSHDPASKSTRHWSAAEDQEFRKLRDQGIPYKDMPSYLPGRTYYSIMSRLAWLRKRATTSELDRPVTPG